MSRSLCFRHLTVAALAVLILGCGGEGSDTVTGPGSTLDSVRVNILLISTSPSIREAKLTLDGRDVASIVALGGALTVPLDATVRGLTRGQHVLRVVIVDQTSSPNLYIAAGAVITTDRILDLAPVQGTLKTGEALEMRVTF